MPEPAHIDRVRGVLLGLAVGDALGAPLEGLSVTQIRAHYRLVRDYVDGMRAWRKKPFRWRLPGLYTDDTQQALALTDVLLKRGSVDLNRLAKMFVDLAEPDGSYAGSHRGIGRSFRLVLAELRRGVAPQRTGQVSVGIGSAMRIAPVGVFFADDPDRLTEAVAAVSLMTHRDIRSVAAAAAVAFGVRRLLRGERREPSFALRLAADVARFEEQVRDRHASVLLGVSEHHHSLSISLARVEAVLDLARPKALAALVDEANRHGPDPACKRPSMGFPPAALPLCLYLLLTTESFEDALTEVVNLGGDADSTGAILGAWAGAHYSIDSIPANWLSGLRNREGIDLRARALATQSTDGLEIPDFLETERQLSEEETFHRDMLLAQRSGNGRWL